MARSEVARVPADIREDFVRMDREATADARTLTILLLASIILYPTMVFISFKSCISSFREWKHLRSTGRRLAGSKLQESRTHDPNSYAES
jgi:hypothetical protein